VSRIRIGEAIGHSPPPACNWPCPAYPLSIGRRGDICDVPRNLVAWPKRARAIYRNARITRKAQYAVPMYYYADIACASVENAGRSNPSQSGRGIAASMRLAASRRRPVIRRSRTGNLLSPCQGQSAPPTSVSRPCRFRDGCRAHATLDSPRHCEVALCREERESRSNP
jgi:hypothetical protein